MNVQHPWNTGFDWVNTGNAAFDRDGFVVVPDLLDAETVRAVVAETDRFEAEMDAFLRSRDDGRLSIAETGAITFSVHLVARSTVLADLSRHPRIVELCQALTDATEANGCPQVVPGLHRQGTLRHTFVDPLGWECLSGDVDAVAAPVPAGGAVVFSSLTPHLTGPNTTDAVRKAYILQYAPAGAEVLRGDPAAGPPSHREAADVPERQYAVLRGGVPC